MLLGVALGGTLGLLPVPTVPYVWLPRTASIRPGIYLRQPRILPLQVGEVVVFQAPLAAQPFLRSLGIEVTTTPLIKQVGATAGHTICYARNHLTMDGDVRAALVRTTSSGVPIPQILTGCYPIPDGAFLPLSLYAPRSYDGRYFGTVPEARVVAKLWPLMYLPRWVYAKD